MEPQIQYAKTRDGVNIAYWMLGDGPPLVMTPGSPVSPTLRSWRSDEGRRFYERLAAHRQVIRYDNRGFGESKSGIVEASLDAWVADLAAVVDRLELSRFPLLGYGFSAPIAIAYAARFPERVSKLVLWGGSARGGDSFNVSRINAARQTAEEDPEFFLRVIALDAFGWSASQHAERYVAAMMEEDDRSFTVEAVLALLELDVTDVLPALRVPVLLLHRRRAPRPTLGTARSLAAELPNARLFVLEGDASPIYLGDTEPVFRAIDDFLGDGPVVPRQTLSVASPPASVVTILFTDLTDSTALTQRLGDAKAQELVRAHNSIVREALAARWRGDQTHRRRHHGVLPLRIRRAGMRRRCPTGGRGER